MNVLLELGLIRNRTLVQKIADSRRIKSVNMLLRNAVMLY